jgi:hypothetical protein
LALLGSVLLEMSEISGGLKDFSNIQICGMSGGGGNLSAALRVTTEKQEQKRNTGILRFAQNDKQKQPQKQIPTG